MSAKLGNPKIVLKTYWSIINKFLSNKKTPIIPFALVNGELVADFNKKLICSTTILLLNVLLLKMVANYQTSVIKLKKY